MVATRDALARAARAARSLADRVESNKLAHVRWLPPQHALLSCTDKRVALRGPNQALGKTYAGAAELLFRLMGRHPYKKVRPGPIRAWVVCGSHEQSRVVQETVWELCPKELVAPGCYYDPTKGAFFGKYPTLRLVNGSEAVFKSGKGSTVSLASGSLDVVWVDEPPASSRVYTELQKRVLKTGGDVYMTFTPVNAPVAWIREECEERKTIRDLWFPLRAEYLVPVGDTEPIRLKDGTVCDQAWIDRLVEETLPYERPVVIGGEWEFRLEGAVFEKSWKPEVHVTDNLPRGTVLLAVGIDYGDRDFKQITLLVAVDATGLYPRIWVLDEAVSNGATTIDQDVAETVAMLHRQTPRVEWNKLDFATGDRVHRGGVQTKGNLDFMKALALELKLPSTDQLRPRIRTAKRGAGQNQESVRVGHRFLHNAMLRPDHFHVHSRCKRLIDSLSKYNGADDGAKDAVDALRYALWPWIFPRIPRAPAPLVRVR